MNQESSVYIAKGKDGLYKIGRSINPKQRAKVQRLELVHTIRSNRAQRLENQFHERFIDKWVRDEFFALTDKDVTDLKAIQALDIPVGKGEVLVRECIKKLEDAGAKVTFKDGETNWSFALHDLLYSETDGVTLGNHFDGDEQLYKAFFAAMDELEKEGVGIDILRVAAYDEIEPGVYELGPKAHLMAFASFFKKATWHRGHAERMKVVAV